MNRYAKNQRAMKALGIARIDFEHYRADKSHWRVTLVSGEQITIALPNLATETTVIRATAQKLAHANHPIEYLKGTL